MCHAVGVKQSVTRRRDNMESYSLSLNIREMSYLLISLSPDLALARYSSYKRSFPPFIRPNKHSDREDHKIVSETLVTALTLTKL